MKNAKNDNASLYSNFPPRFLKVNFQQGAMVPPAPSYELMALMPKQLKNVNDMHFCLFQWAGICFTH